MAEDASGIPQQTSARDAIDRRFYHLLVAIGIGVPIVGLSSHFLYLLSTQPPSEGGYGGALIWYSYFLFLFFCVSAFALLLFGYPMALVWTLVFKQTRRQGWPEQRSAIVGALAISALFAIGLPVAYAILEASLLTALWGATAEPRSISNILRNVSVFFVLASVISTPFAAWLYRKTYSTELRG